MTPELPENPDLVPLLRQQLILAQVRIMELEDIRDTLEPRLAEIEQTLKAAQILADQKLDESAHLLSVQSDLQAQLQHWRHVQHVANEALSVTQTQLEAANHTLSQQNDQLTIFTETHQRSQEALANTQAQLGETLAQSKQLAARIQTLDTEMRAVKQSRSWRWTRWLRSIERLLRRAS